MGRSKKGSSWMKVPAKRRPPRRVHAEEVIEMPGGGTIARAGNVIEMRSKRTAAEHRAWQEQLAAKHPDVVRDIQGHVDAVAELVPRFSPVELLGRAYTEFFGGMLGKEGEHEVDFANTVDIRMLDYVQAVIVSRPPSNAPTDFDEASWKDLRAHVSDLYELLQFWASTETAVRDLAGGADPAVEQLRMPLLFEWLCVRGARYTVHERERLQALLAPHDEVLVRLFGVDASAIALGVEAVQRRLTLGLGEAVAKLHEIHQAAVADESLSDFDPSPYSSSAELANALLDRTGRREEFEAAGAQAFGLALFEVSDLFPRELLSLVALSPGEDTTLYAPGDHRGWPVRTSPTSLRPVLRVDGHYYVFDPFATDHFYRAIERAILVREPTYRERWNVGQKQVTEQLPLDLLGGLLAGATIYRGVAYQVVEGSTTKWCECDAVIVLDDIVIAIEVKAGRATERSPLEDFEAHVRNAQALLLSPAQQADRFIAYLDSAHEVPIYDDGHREVARLRRDSVRRRVRCAITADSLARLAGVFQHEPAVTQSPVSPTWCLSLDDLYAYRDVLGGSVGLSHYLKYRVRAFELPQLAGVDELDHLGAYLRTNAYTDWITDVEATRVVLHGYRAALDDFFGRAWSEGSLPEPPSQPLPPLLRQVVTCLELRRPPGFLRAGEALLDLDGEARTSAAEMMEASYVEAVRTGRSRVMSMYGPDGLLVVAVGTSGTSSEPTAVHVDHALTVIAASGSENAVLIEVAMHDRSTVSDATCRYLDLSTLAPDVLDRLHAQARTLKARRLERARSEGIKLGRNAMCPCGSGRKYKKCCLRR